MKRVLALLALAAIIFVLPACGMKAAVQNKTMELLGGGSANTAAGSGNENGISSQSGGMNNNGGGSADPRDDQKSMSSTGGSTWVLRINEATVLDMMGLAVVDYECDLTATHTGPDMFGIYTGEIGIVYDADLSGLQELMGASGVDMDYKTNGWFKNTDFKIELTPYTDEAEAHFTDSLKDPDVTDDERALMNSLMGSMFAGVGSGDKDFETAKEPVGLWYDWAFHMTEGDMSAYVNMNSAMFSASASQDAKAQTAEGYANAILAGSFHESLSYKDESPFPYQIEVYEGGEAVLTLRNATESPIVVKFYGAISKN